MFSGIVETTAQIVDSREVRDVVQIHIARPSTFDDLKIGDSIAVNGICLTLEKFDSSQMQFALGQETLRVTGWSASSVLNRAVNLERSLRLQDRIHGHLVTGHVDAKGKVVEVERFEQTQIMRIEFPKNFAPFIWSKGSVALNGVSLTINQVDASTLTVGLIPETLKRTNLGELKVGDSINLEIDNMARGLVNFARVQQESL